MPRDRNHEYRSRCIYHITCTKAAGIPEFSSIEGELPAVTVRLSALGESIEYFIKRISDLCPAIQLYRYIVMPDHIHFLIFVRETIPLPVGQFIGMMKIRIHHAAIARKIITPDQHVFEYDFYDRILRPWHKLNDIFVYIERNPYRLAVRRAHRNFFRRTMRLYIEDIQFQAYGNLQLLGNPFKEAVIVHRADSAKTRKANHDRWIHLAANGGVLASPFIAAAEKEIRREAEEIGTKLIVFYNKAFGERFKPAKHDFELCEQGRLLIIAPMEDMPDGRATFLYLNEKAEALASNKFRLGR